VSIENEDGKFWSIRTEAASGPAFKVGGPLWHTQADSVDLNDRLVPAGPGPGQWDGECHGGTSRAYY
jgi:hypothetical protein